MAATPRGEFDTGIVFERAVTGTDGRGTERPLDWGRIVGAWAKVLNGTGAERRQAAAEEAVQTAIFRVLRTPSIGEVTERDTIVARGTRWAIRGIAPRPGLDAEIEFACAVHRG